MNDSATVIVNGSVQSDSIVTSTNGDFRFLLDTQPANEGLYVLEVSVNPRASVSFNLVNSAPVRTQEDTGPILTVPTGIGLDKSVFLPLVSGGQ